MAVSEFIVAVEQDVQRDGRDLNPPNVIRMLSINYGAAAAAFREPLPCS
jgi:hypothetical protein